MARAIENGDEDFITSCRRTFHTLDVMTAFQRSSESGSIVYMEK